ncbi:MAG: hypothetical protein AAF908_04650 [Pseudomonadota bacterium]
MVPETRMELIARLRSMGPADRSVLMALIENPGAAQMTAPESPLHVLWQQLAIRGWSELAPEGKMLGPGMVLFRLTEMGQRDFPGLVRDALGSH